MRQRTPHYKLDVFGLNEIYSASGDRRRFTIIDNQLAYLSDMIGDGRILGWKMEDISEGADKIVSLSPGMGIIGRNIVHTFGSESFFAEENKVKYVYLKELPGVSGGISGFSNMDTISVEYDIKPDSPSGLTEISSLTSYNQTTFSWDMSDEPDFSHYIVRQVILDHNGEVEFIDKEEEIIENSYTATNLSENVTFFFQVLSVNFSGNISDPSTISITTSIDYRTPLPPLFFQVFSQDNSFQSIWDHSPSSNVDKYKITVRYLDTGEEVVVHYIDQNNDDDPFSSTTALIDGLQNSVDYIVDIQSVNMAGVESSSITKRVRPRSIASTGEVFNASIDFERSDIQGVKFETNIKWSYDSGTKYEDPEEFHITFIENGNRFSEVIRRKHKLLYDYQHILKYLPFKDDEGNLRYESIKEYTPYLVIIQTVDNLGNKSNGIFIRVNRTPTYDVLPRVTDLSIERLSGNKVLIEWDNPSLPYLDHLKFTCKITNLSTDEVTFYMNEENIGKSDNITVPSSYFQIGYRYTVTVVPVDVFGDDGDQNVLNKNFIKGDEDPYPNSPANLSVIAKDSEVVLTWDRDLSDDIVSYHIYRAEDKMFLRDSDFDLITEISATNDMFIDYSAQNGKTYSYFIIAENIYGNKSYDIGVEDKFFGEGYVIARPRQSSLIDAPYNLQVSVKDEQSAKYDALIEWDISGGNFDGYEIYRSVGNKYNFKLIGSLSAHYNSYVDESILLEDNINYYYMVRKYKNEAELFVTESSIVPMDSIFVGKVSLENDIVKIDDSDVIDLYNFEDPLRIRTQKYIADHTHHFRDNIDRRIELRGDLRVENWETVDYQTYRTDMDISGAAQYVLRISGDIRAGYFEDEDGTVDINSLHMAQSGFSPIRYEIDKNNNQIVFVEPLYTTCVEPPTQDIDTEPICPSVPYDSEPVIILEMIGMSETKGDLLEDKIESLSATQINSGKIDYSQLPEINHDGRINEDLEPIRAKMWTNDGYVFYLANSYNDEDRNRIGNCITFYDILNLHRTEWLLAASSDGILFSKNYGTTWEHKQSFEFPVYKLFKDSKDRIFAITNRAIYLSEDVNYSQWRSMNGLEYVNIIRDIIEDSENNLYITTDLGVFRFNESKPYLENTWEQLSLFGLRSSQSYGILFQEEINPSIADNPSILNGCIIVSTDSELLISYNRGKSWEYASYLIDEPVKIRKFYSKNSYTFAVTDNSLFRQSEVGLSFHKIANFSFGRIEDMSIFSDVIYLSTDQGVKKSLGNIYESSDIDFVDTWSSINIKEQKLIIRSLNLIDNFLFAGTESKIFRIDADDIWLQFDQGDTIIPTIFKSGSIQKTGFYYNNNDSSPQNIVFDEVVIEDESVDVVNKYNIFQVRYGGWADVKYDTKFAVMLNDNIYGYSPLEIEVDIEEFLNLEFPEFNDLTSHYNDAFYYYTEVRNKIDTLIAEDAPTGDDFIKFIAEIYYDIEKMLSYIYPEHRIIQIDGTEIDFKLPRIETSIVKRIPDPNDPVGFREEDLPANVNIASGIIYFDKNFDKYDKLKINIYDVIIKNTGEYTHREVEDKMEYVNSGLPSSLSQIQQVNINNLNIWTEKQYPNQKNIISSCYQSDTIIPDYSNWFDSLNSSINYKKHLSLDNITMTLPYVTSSIFLDEINKVLIGGRGGVFSIDIDTWNINKVLLSNLSSSLDIKNFYRHQNRLYIVEKNNIYFKDNINNINIWNDKNWKIYDRTGLPNVIYNLSSIYGSLVCGAEDGVYYQSSELANWEKVLDSKYPVMIMLNPNLLFIVVDSEILMTGNGYTFNRLDVSNLPHINNIIRMGNVFYIATAQGLYTDSKSFYSENPRVYLVDISNNSSDIISVNDINSFNNKMIVGLDDGTYYIMENGKFVYREYSGLQTVHNCLVVDNNGWLFGHDFLQIDGFQYPIKLSTGFPL